MPFSGDASALTEAGAIYKDVFRRQFVVPAINDIEALQDGSGITMASLVQMPSLLSTTKVMVRGPGATYYATVADIAKLVPSITGSWVTASQIGLVGDGIADDAPAMQRAYDLYAGTGAVFYLKSTHANNLILLRGRVRHPSGLTVICATPFKALDDGGYDISGNYAYVASRDAFRLLSNAAAAATTLSIDTSPHGGGNVSGYLAVGDLLEITGRLDSAGSPVAGQREVVRVTSVTDPSTVGITALSAAFSVSYTAGDYEAAWTTINRTIIRKLVSSRLSADLAAGDNVATLNTSDLGRLSPGDMVMVEDERLASDVRGTSPWRLHREPAVISAAISGDATSQVRVAHRVEHSFATGSNARVVKIDPVRDASVSGASFLFASSPDLTGAITYAMTMRFAVDCEASGCSVPNTDVYGRRGMFFMNSCRNSVWRDAHVRNVRFYGEGEGIGVLVAHSRGCEIVGGKFDNVRHGVAFYGSTNCYAVSPAVNDSRRSPLAFVGLEEVGCLAIDPRLSGGVHSPDVDGRNPSAIVFGGTYHLSGAKRCGVSGGRVVGFRSEDGTHNPAIRFYPPSDECWVKGTAFDDIGILYQHEDLASYGDITATQLTLSDLEVNGCASWIADIDGRVNGAGIDTLVGLLIEGLSVKGARRGFRVKRATAISIIDLEATDVAADSGYPYLVEAESITRLRLEDMTVSGWLRGVSLTSCGNSWRVQESDFGALGDGIILRDAGGNDGGLWRDNVAHGTASTLLRATRGGSAMIEVPRLAAPTVLADDALLTLTPPREVGIFYVCEHRDVNLFARCIYFTVAPSGTPGMQYSDNTSNVQVTTGDITSGGTDGKFVISVYNGLIQMRNRLGSSITIDFAYL